jgi:hypothetical protein
VATKFRSPQAAARPQFRLAAKVRRTMPRTKRGWLWLAVSAAACLATAIVATSLLGLSRAGPSGGAYVTVPVDVPWTDTGIAVRPSQLLSISSQGEISPAAGVRAGPEGVPGRQQDPLAALPDANYAALVGKIGGGAAFVVGDERTVRAQTGGELFLGANDLEYQDNTGFYSAQINLE